MPSFRGILGEHKSDAESLAILIRRMETAYNLPKIGIKKHGFGGSSRLLSNGAGMLRAWGMIGCVSAIVCYDADNDPNQSTAFRRELIERQVIKKSGVDFVCHPIVPVQELEAWWHGDIVSLEKKYNWCRGLRQHNSPESINNPKEELKRLTKHPVKGKFYYDPPNDNPFMARVVNIEKIAAACPSFVELVNIIISG